VRKDDPVAYATCSKCFTLGPKGTALESSDRSTLQLYHETARHLLVLFLAHAESQGTNRLQTLQRSAWQNSYL